MFAREGFPAKRRNAEFGGAAQVDRPLPRSEVRIGHPDPACVRGAPCRRWIPSPGRSTVRGRTKASVRLDDWAKERGPLTVLRKWSGTTLRAGPCSNAGSRLAFYTPPVSNSHRTTWAKASAGGELLLRTAESVAAKFNSMNLGQKPRPASDTRQHHVDCRNRQSVPASRIANWPLTLCRLARLPG